MEINLSNNFSNLASKLNPRWKIYIDTCSLYKSMFNEDAFWGQLEKVLLDSECKFTITTAVFNEFKKHKHGDNSTLNEQAAQLEKRLWKYSKNNLDLMLTKGDPNDPFNDNVIVAFIKERSRKFNQIYITNDMANAWDVYNVFHNSYSSNSTNSLEIYKVNNQGDIVKYQELPFLSTMKPKDVKKFFKMRNEASIQEDSKKKRKMFNDADEFLGKKSGFIPYRHNSKQKYEEAKKAVQKKQNEEAKKAVQKKSSKKIQITPLLNPDIVLPSVGDALTAYNATNSFNFTLGERIALGGEGYIYNIEEEEYSGLVVKIYKKNKFYKSIETANKKLDKLIYIVEKDFNEVVQKIRHSNYRIGDFVKFPKYLLINSNGEFVGCIMEKAKGIEASNIINDGNMPLAFSQNFPNIKKIDLLEICKSFLLGMKLLHKNNIIVGDLNTGNILVDIETNKVSLIDADSYQYSDKYLCDVGVKRYTAPEFLIDHSDKKRTVNNERFVMAYILCEFLTLSDNPYKSKFGKNPEEDMINGEFGFTFEFDNGSRQTNKAAPDEAMAIRWGQLTKALKDAFGNTFHKNGAYWNQENRLSEDFWIVHIDKYIKEITELEKLGFDFVSNEAIPTKRRVWYTYCNCSYCGESGFVNLEEYRKIYNLYYATQEIFDIGKNRHLECYCDENSLETQICCHCGEEYFTDSGHVNKYPTCPSCNSYAVCPVCGSDHFYVKGKQERKFKKWMLDENGGMCLKCKEEQ